MVTISILGSSLSWSPRLITDIMMVFKESIEFRLVDINPEAARLCRQWGEAATKACGRKDRFLTFTDRRKALLGTDAVIITLSTGGLDAMEQDILIPEKYGIYATVGDTAGPGGWSRSIRNIPVFMEFASDFDRLCPSAFIVNYTNPMSSLTATLCRCCGNPVVGLCHSYFHMKDLIQKIFGLPDWERISLVVAGMNHFIWLIRFNIGREDGYELLRKKINGGSLADVLTAGSEDDIGYFSGTKLCAELYDAYGYIPYPGDRHISEFVSFTLSAERKNITKSDGESFEVVSPYEVVRTPITKRRKDAASLRESIVKDAQLLDEGNKPLSRSRETGADMIAAYLYNKPMFDAVNALNVGQIAGLPEGACVETMGMVDGLGVHPMAVGEIPGSLLEIMRPQAVCQKWITEGVIDSDQSKLLSALYHDPQCSHLTPTQIRSMARELMEANAKTRAR